MMEISGRGDVVMNLVGLILIAALSGGIVAVSLRLRASASSARMWLDSHHLSEDDLQQPVQSAGRRGAAWLQDSFGLKGESGLYRAVKDQIGS